VGRQARAPTHEHTLGVLHMAFHDAQWFRRKTPNIRVYRTIWHAFHDEQAHRSR